MKDRDLSFDRTCHVLYSKACKKQIQQKIALHYPPEQREAVWKQVQLQYVAGLQKTAQLRAGDRNPFSWNMDFCPYPDDSGYEARFTQCGICTLMKKLGLYDLTPALCHLDYTMSEAGGATRFVRQYTLVSGGPYCDCGYKKLTSGQGCPVNEHKKSKQPEQVSKC